MSVAVDQDCWLGKSFLCGDWRLEIESLGKGDTSQLEISARSIIDPPLDAGIVLDLFVLTFVLDLLIVLAAVAIVMMTFT